MEMEGKSMAEMMDNEKKPAPTLPVSMEKQQQQARAAPPFLHIDAVHLVNPWTIFNAVAVTISFGVAAAYTLIVSRYDPSQASWLLPPAATKVTVTHAEDAQISAIVIGMLWCSTPQAAAGALALLLPCHRWRVRRAAAYAALAVTVASHCMLAGAVLVSVRADPEAGLFFTIVGTAGIFICALGDLPRLPGAPPFPWRGGGLRTCLELHV